MFLSRTAGGIAAIARALPRVDAPTFTGGIGEHSGLVREGVLQRLAPMVIQVLTIEVREDAVVASQVLTIPRVGQTVDILLNVSKPDPPVHPPYLHGTGPGEQRRLEAQAELLGGDRFLPPLASGMKVLDVGCGTGAIARQVARRHVDVVGLDREPDEIAAAQELASQAAVNVTFQIGTAEALPYADATFDGSYCRFLLEHLVNPLPALSEMARVVKPGGWICALEWEPDALVMHPASPNVLEVWRAIYQFQASTGADPRIGRRLFELFKRVGLNDVKADTLAWSVSARELSALQMYVSGAREIIGQTRTSLLGGRYIEPKVLELALAEYEAVLTSPSTFISHVFCRAVGIRR